MGPVSSPSKSGPKIHVSYRISVPALEDILINMEMDTVHSLLFNISVPSLAHMIIKLNRQALPSQFWGHMALNEALGGIWLLIIDELHCYIICGTLTLSKSTFAGSH
jgi:hypothetical protein